MSGSGDHNQLNKCAVCQERTSKCCGGCELIFYCCNEHQKNDWKSHKRFCKRYEIQHDESSGSFMTAARYIETGLIVAVEFPVAEHRELVPSPANLQKVLNISGIKTYLCPSCESPFLDTERVHFCSKCKIPLCKENCEKSGLHTNKECQAIQQVKCELSTSLKNTLEDISLFRVLLEEKSKPDSLAFKSAKWQSLMKKVFSEEVEGSTLGPRIKSLSADIMNSFESSQERPLSLKYSGCKELATLIHCALKSCTWGIPGETNRKLLYTKNFYLSHSCMPNSEAWIDNIDNSYRLVVKALESIPTGDKITINKTPELTILPTRQRRKKLLSLLGIKCKCSRCRDPTELGSFISAVRCEENSNVYTHCYGYYVPLKPLEDDSPWECTESRCTSRKSVEEIDRSVKNALKALPTVGNDAEVSMKKLMDFVEFYSGDVLHPSHYVLLNAKARIRQIIRYFLDSDEKMFLCLMNDFTRVYDYCKINLLSLRTMLNFVDNFSPAYGKKRGKLLLEKAWYEFALALYECKILHLSPVAACLIRTHEALSYLDEAEDALSIYDASPSVENVRKQISSLRAVIKTIFPKLPESLLRITCGSSLYESVGTILLRSIENWKIKCKEINLITYYLEPLTPDSTRSASPENLAKVIISNCYKETKP